MPGDALDASQARAGSGSPSDAPGPRQGSSEENRVRELSDTELATELERVASAHALGPRPDRRVVLNEAARRLRWGTQREKEQG